MILTTHDIRLAAISVLMNLLLTSGAGWSAMTQESITFADFNQDFSSFIVGTKHGFAIFACDASLKCYYRGRPFYPLTITNDVFIIIVRK